MAGNPDLPIPVHKGMVETLLRINRIFAATVGVAVVLCLIWINA